MFKVLKNLALAMLNATLILVAISLFFLWRVTATADKMAQDFAENISIIAPLRKDIQGTTAELAAIRSDLKTLAAGSGQVSSAALQGLQARISGIEYQLETATRSLATLTDAPKNIVDYAVEKSADEIAAQIIRIRGCQDGPV